MNLSSDQSTLVVVILVIAAIALVAGLAARRRRRDGHASTRLPDTRTLPTARRAARSRDAASRAAADTPAGVSSLVPLTQAEARRFGQSWSDIQAQFVDSPREAVVRADLLVRELMLKRGFPMGDFEQRATDLAAEHADLVANFRAAQAIAARTARATVDTEELRRAVVHYRALFEELLGAARARAVPEAVRG